MTIQHGARPLPSLQHSSTVPRTPWTYKAPACLSGARQRLAAPQRSEDEMASRHRTPRFLVVAPVLATLLVGVAAPARAQEPAPRPSDGHLAKGDYFFKAGYYLKASEHYRLALLEDPASPGKKLAFGHALFAIGNYSYASYALRRGVAQLDADDPFRPSLEALFPSKRAFTQALRDLKRYVTYSPRDPAGLSVLGYVLFSIEGEETRCRDMFKYLKRLDPNDPFAEFFLAQIRRRGVPDGDEQPAAAGLPEVGDVGGDDVVEAPPEPAPAPRPAASPPPPPPPPTPAAPDLKQVLQEPERARERAEGEWPSPVPAPSR